MTDRLQWAIDQVQKEINDSQTETTRKDVCRGELKDLQRQLRKLKRQQAFRPYSGQVLIAKLDDIPTVQLAEGTHKFAMVTVTPMDTGNKTYHFVRSKDTAKYHYLAIEDLLDHLMIDLGLTDNEIDVPGGGRCERDQTDHHVFVYGFSNQYGQPDMKLVRDIIKAQPEYTDWTVTYSLDGY